MSVELGEWIRLFRQEYLSDFIPSGGSTVKILVCPDGNTYPVIAALEEASSMAGMLTVTVDAATTKIQMIDKVYFAVANSIDWAAHADQWLRLRLAAYGYVVPAEIPLNDLDAIAAASAVDRKSLQTAINRLITSELLHDSLLWGEFRNAIAHFCVSRVHKENVTPRNAETILQWLRGEKASLVELKRGLRIYQRIGRQNARPILISTVRWLHKAGCPGLTLLLELSAAYEDREGGNRYTRNAVLDLYEMLRQFIDQTDEAERFTLVAVAGPGIIDDPKKDYRNYDAFMLRVVNDVRDRARDNPLNVLVRLNPQSEPLERQMVQ